jgi:hypothetical protein
MGRFVGILVAVLVALQPIRAEADVIFEDDFVGATINWTKWEVYDTRECSDEVSSVTQNDHLIVDINPTNDNCGHLGVISALDFLDYTDNVSYEVDFWTTSFRNWQDQPINIRTPIGEVAYNNPSGWWLVWISPSGSQQWIKPDLGQVYDRLFRVKLALVDGDLQFWISTDGGGYELLHTVPNGSYGLPYVPSGKVILSQSDRGPSYFDNLVVTASGSGVEYPETWYKSPCNPVFTASGNPSYPTVVHTGGTYEYIMYFDKYSPPQHIEWATSDDAVNWTEQGALITPGMNGEFNWHDISISQVLYNENTGEYWMYYGADDGTPSWRAIGLATSPDAVTWDDQGEVFSVGSGTWDSYSVGSPQVIWDESAGLYYMLYAGNGTGYGLGLASSTDGYSFTRVGTAPVISPGSGSDFDANGVHRVDAFFEENGKYVCYYSGRNSSNSWAVGKAEATSVAGPWTKLGRTLYATEPWEGNSIGWCSVLDVNGVRTAYYQSTNYRVGIAQFEDMGSECIVASPEPQDCQPQADYQSPYAPDDCTVGLWPADEGSGTDVIDASGGGSNGTLYGVGWGTHVESTTDFGGCLVFDDHDSAKVSLTNTGFITGSHTIEAWVKPAVTNVTQTVLCLYSSSQQVQIPIIVHDDGKVSFRVCGTGSQWDEIKGTTSLQPGAWYHVAGVWDQSTHEMSVYVNGQEENSKVLSYSPTTLRNGTFDFGKMWTEQTVPNGAALYFSGSIDEVRISNVARTSNPQPDDDCGPTTAFHESKFSYLGGYPAVTFQCHSDDRQSGGSPISGAEYFWDVDPGQGRGIPLDPEDGSFDSPHELLSAIDIDLRSLGSEEHILSIRSRDEVGNWGAIVSEAVQTTSSRFDPLTDGFNFKNWGIIPHCSGMAWANEFLWRLESPIPDNDIALLPPDAECPDRTSRPPELSPTWVLINIFQWGFLPEGAKENLRIRLKWFLDRSEWIRTQYNEVQDLLESGYNGIMYLVRSGPGGHAVQAYRTARIGTDLKCIFLYDPNYPNNCPRTPSNTGILINSSGSIWEPLDGDDIYDGYESFGLSAFWMEVYRVSMLIARCPIEVEVATSIGDYISKDSVSRPGLTYSTTTAFDDDGDSIQKVLYFGLDYPQAAYSIRVVPHDTASEDSRVTLLFVSSGDVTVLADSVAVREIPQEGYFFSTLDTGSVSGIVSSNATGLLGIPVDLYDEGGSIVASTVTDEAGQYCFAGLNNGDYALSISTPLGYQADQETRQIEVKGLPHTINFELTKLQITPAPRTRGYWANQLLKAMQNKPQDYNVGHFAQFAGLINQHFNQNEINPVDFFSVPQPASRQDSLMALKTLLHMMGDCQEPFLKRLAKAQLMALMLNVVSGKLSQTEAITADGNTVSQVVTYCDMLVNDEIDVPDDGGPGHGSPWCRYIRADFVLTFVNLHLQVPAWLIPNDVIQITYRQAAELNMPTDFSLEQNHPNPFNPSTEISFSLPVTSQVRLDVFNIMGQKVTALVNGSLPAGKHNVTWNGKSSAGETVASGVYFYKIEAAGFTDVKKMLLMK